MFINSRVHRCQGAFVFLCLVQGVCLCVCVRAHMRFGAVCCACPIGDKT